MKITLGEAFGWAASKLQEFTLGAVPDKDKLDILMRRMTEDRDNKRREYHAALAQEYVIFNPAEDKDGTLEIARNQLALREQQGTKWGKELGETTSTRRKGELNAYLEQCERDCERLEGEIKSLESQLKMRSDTTKMRKERFEKADADLRKLQQVAPTLLAQTQALKDAQADRMRALEDASKGGGNSADASSLLAELTAELDQARAGDSAAQTIELEETPHNIDLDEVAAQEARESGTSARRARWTAKEPATAGAEA